MFFWTKFIFDLLTAKSRYLRLVRFIFKKKRKKSFFLLLFTCKKLFVNNWNRRHNETSVISRYAGRKNSLLSLKMYNWGYLYTFYLPTLWKYAWSIPAFCLNPNSRIFNILVSHSSISYISDLRSKILF